VTIRSDYFAWRWPDDYRQYGHLTFPADLDLAGEGADEEVSLGCLMAIDPANIWQMVYATGNNFFGILMQNVDDHGTIGDKAMIDLMYGRRGDKNEDMPVKRGRPVSLIVPPPFSMAEFEGVGVSAIGNFVITSGDGAISSSTPFGTELSASNGGWKIAGNDEFVFARILDANLDPVADENNVRIKVQFVSPYPSVGSIYF